MRRARPVLRWQDEVKRLSAGTTWVSMAAGDTLLRLNGSDELARLRQAITDADAAGRRPFEMAVPTSRGMLYVIAERGILYLAGASRVRLPGYWKACLRELREWLAYLDAEQPAVRSLAVQRKRGTVLLVTSADEECDARKSWQRDYVGLSVAKATRLRDHLLKSLELEAPGDFSVTGSRNCDEVNVAPGDSDFCYIELSTDESALYACDFSRSQAAILAMKIDAAIGGRSSRKHESPKVAP